MAPTEGHLTGGSSRSWSPEGDHRSSDEIRRDIEKQRDELDVTTEVLQRKLAPRELAEQLWNDVRTRVGSGAGDMVDVVKRHPVPFSLIGAGIAWWIYETSRGRSFGNGGSYDEELGVGSMSTGSYQAGSSYGAETDPESYYRTGYSEGWRERSRDLAHRSAERLREGAHVAREGFAETVDRNPLALGAACFSLGILAGIAVPSTRWEDETMGEASRTLGRKAKRAAKDAAWTAAQQGVRAAQTAAERLREEAESPSAESYRPTESYPPAGTYKPAGPYQPGDTDKPADRADGPDPWDPDDPARR
jgi:hypothetical protein